MGEVVFVLLSCNPDVMHSERDAILSQLNSTPQVVYATHSGGKSEGSARAFRIGVAFRPGTGPYPARKVIDEAAFNMVTVEHISIVPSNYREQVDQIWSYTKLAELHPQYFGR